MGRPLTCGACTQNFFDVSYDDWGLPYIRKAYQLLGSAASGCYSDTSFCPDATVTRGSAGIYLVDGILRGGIPGTDPVSPVAPTGMSCSSPTFLRVNSFLRIGNDTYSEVSYQVNPATPVSYPELWSLSLKGDVVNNGYSPIATNHQEAWASTVLKVNPLHAFYGRFAWNTSTNYSQKLVTQTNSLCLGSGGGATLTTTDPVNNNVPYIAMTGGTISSMDPNAANEVSSGGTVVFRGSYPDTPLEHRLRLEPAGTYINQPYVTGNAAGTEMNVQIPGFVASGTHTAYMDVRRGTDWVLGTPGVQLQVMPGATVPQTITTN